jgi:hypothetical protein
MSALSMQVIPLPAWIFVEAYAPTHELFYSRRPFSDDEFNYLPVTDTGTRREGILYM